MHQPPNAVQDGMGRPTADTVQVTFRVPSYWVAQADVLAALLSRHGMDASRTDVFREAIAVGMQEIIANQLATQYRVSAWDGRNTTCLFWFGRDEKEALKKSKELADEHSAKTDSKWTLFRVYKGDEREPIAFDIVSHGKTASERLHSRATTLARELDRKPANKTK